MQPVQERKYDSNHSSAITLDNMGRIDSLQMGMATEPAPIQASSPPTTKLDPSSIGPGTLQSLDDTRPHRNRQLPKKYLENGPKA
jgi:hypothetical protein